MIAVNPGRGPRICILKLTDDSDDGKHCVGNKKKREWDLIMEGFKKQIKNLLLPKTVLGST